MSLCILTDSSAQFSHPNFFGKELVHVLPIHVFGKGGEKIGVDTLRQGALPVSLAAGEKPEVLVPSVDDIRRTFDHLGTKFDEILVLLPSNQLGGIIERTREAAEISSKRDSILIIDSQSVSIGLGMFVQAAAQHARLGHSRQEIKKMLLGLMEHVYSIFCLDGLTYLSKSGFLAESQALVGEWLKVRPLYMLEKGRLVPIQKVRNARHMVECLYEFIGEFAGVGHIALVQGVPPYEQEARALRDRIGEDLPDTPVSEHIISPPLAAVFGPRTLGLFVWEPGEFELDLTGGR